MMNNVSYTAIQDWMLDLGLDIYETVAYAVIFGFSQDGESTFKGSLAYLGRKMMCSRSTVIRSLKEMTERGFLQKIEITRNGVKFCEYRAIVPNTGGVCETPGGGGCGTPYNKEQEIIEIEENTKEDTLFGGGEEAGCLERPIATSQTPTKKEGANRAAATLAERESAFKDECHKFVEEFGERLVEEFVLYWTEPNKSKTRMRFEQQTTWDTHRRLLTWKRNNFNKYDRIGAQPREEHYLTAEEIDRVMNWRRDD